MRKVTLITGVLSIIVLLSCCGKGRKPFFQADISGIDKIDVNIGRYEKVLFEADTLNLVKEIEPFIDKFPFLGNELFTQEGQQQLFEYVTNSLNRILYQDVQEVWPDLDDLERDISEAFRYYRFHFPEEPLPEIYSYISGLNYENPITLFENNTLAVGLDMYLGSDFELYPQMGIAAYRTFKMQPPFVKVDLIKLLADKHLWQLSRVPETFLDFMVYEGKALYFIDCLLPWVNDSLKIGYTGEQLKWFDQNSGLAWSFFLENEMLYSSDRQTIIKFIGEAPFTAPFGRSSPPRTAAFIGWQIVREYMRKNRQVTLPDLLSNTNSQEILKKSGYRPR
jgi:hypothetical protein